jgi:hypothetical protein
VTGGAPLLVPSLSEAAALRLRQELESAECRSEAKRIFEVVAAGLDEAAYEIACLYLANALLELPEE